MGAPDQGERLQRGLNVSASGAVSQQDERAVVVTPAFELVESLSARPDPMVRVLLVIVPDGDVA